MNRQFLVLLILPLKLISCNKEQGTIEERDLFGIKDTLSVQSEPVTVDMYYPTHLKCFGNLLMVYDSYAEKEILKIFELPSLSYKYSWGEKGNGPEQLMLVDPSTFVKRTENSFEWVDNGRLKSYLVLEDDIEELQSLQLPILRNPLNRFIRINDTIGYANGPVDEFGDEHIIIDLKENVVNGGFGDYFGEQEKFPSPVHRYINLSKKIASQNGLFLTAYSYYQRMNVYNDKGELMRTIEYGNDQGMDKLRENRKEALALYPVQVATTSNYIFLLIAGVKDPVNVLLSKDFKPLLQIWNWEGEHIESYVLDRPITGFTVSDDSRTLYGVWVESINELFKVDLPKLKEVN